MKSVFFKTITSGLVHRLKLILIFHYSLVCCTPKFSDSFATQSSKTENNFRQYNKTLFDDQSILGTIFNDGVFSEKLVQNYVLSFDSVINNLYVNIYINIFTYNLKFNKMYKEHNKMQ